MINQSQVVYRKYFIASSSKNTLTHILKCMIGVSSKSCDEIDVYTD